MGKAPRDPQSNVKGQAKERDKPKTPDSGKEMDSSKPNYDYHEGSIHDVSLRQDVSRGYERFKVCRRPPSPQGDDEMAGY